MPKVLGDQWRKLCRNIRFSIVEFQWLLELLTLYQMVEDSIIVPKSIMDIEFKVFWTNIKNQPSLLDYSLWRSYVLTVGRFHVVICSSEQSLWMPSMLGIIWNSDKPESCPGCESFVWVEANESLQSYYVQSTEKSFCALYEFVFYL